MTERKELPFTIIIYDKLSKSFVVSAPINADTPSLRAGSMTYRDVTIPMLNRVWMWRILRGVTRS